MSSTTREKILHASFNQDNSCIAIGTDSSYKVFTTDPFGKCFDNDGGMSCVQMLYSTSLLALVGAGQQASLSPRRLQLFNTSEQKVICELSFLSTILNVLLTRKRLVVVLETKIHLFDISTMKVVRTIETMSNKKGICALVEAESDGNYFSYLAYPYGSERDQVGDVMVCDAINPRPLNVVKAHKGPLSAIQFNSDGTLLATASNKGTVIRLFSLPSTNLLCTLRRGSYAATIYSLSFSNDSSLLSVSSDTGTVHVFKLTKAGIHSNNDGNSVLDSDLSISEVSETKTKKQNVGTLSDTIGNLWDSVRDFAHCKIKTTMSDNRNISSIAPSGDAIMVLTYDGYLHKYSLDLVNGGEAKLESSFFLFKPTEK